MPDPRQRRRAGVWFSLLAAIVTVTTTCSDSPFRPGQTASASLDVAALLAAAESTPIPIDTFVVELRRFSDSVLVVSDTIDADSVGIAADADSVTLDVTVPLETDPEQFYLYVAVMGEGVVWYVVEAVVTATTTEPATTPELTAGYVGPGSDATSVTISLTDTTITGGDSVLVTGTVYHEETVIDGAPVSFTSSDDALVPEPAQVGRNQAWVRAPAALTDSVTVTATATTALEPLTAGGTLRFYARPNSIVLVSGSGQTLNPGETAPDPLVVRVVDAAGDPFTRGYQVVFTMTAGPTGTTVAPTTTVTDAQGLAQATVTAGDAPGAVSVTAEAQGLTGSPVSFTAAIGDVSAPADLAIQAGNGQTATVATVLPVSPAVMVTDGVGSPVQGVAVTFAVATGAGSVTGAMDTTDAGGIATVGAWTLGQTAGANTLTATVVGLQSVTFTATGIADAPATLLKISGDDQTADGGTALPAPLVVEVQDRFGNPAPNATVDWSVSDGSVSPTSNQTDGNGRAQTTWTLGATAQSQVATAMVSALQPVTFTATATFVNPIIFVTLVGTDRIAVGGSAFVEIALSSAAPTGGVTVAVTSDNAAIAAVQSPGSVFIAEGATTGQIGVDGVSSGATTIRGNAVGWTEGTLTVDVSPLVLSLPATLNVPFGGTSSIPVQISTPAPAGGEVVSLVSSDPSLVAIAAPTVTIPEGLQTANGTVSGVFPGTVTVTATSATYGTTQATVSTTANLNIVQSSATINATFGTDIRIQLQSAGSAIAAPAGGISVTLTAADPTCVTATSPVLIPAGLVDVTATVTYGGSATLTCATMLTASAADIVSDSISVTVNPAPGISTAARTVGSGLQRSTSASFGAANHGGVAVVIASSDPSVMLVSPNASTAGTDSITVSLANGSTSVSYYVQGVEGATGSPSVTVSAPGFTDGTATMTVVQPALQLSGPAATTTTLSADGPFWVGVGIPNGQLTSIAEWQNVRPGGSLTATVTSSDVAVGQLVTTALTGGSVTVDIVPGLYYSPTSVAAGGVAFDPITAGTTTVAASIPNIIALPTASRQVTVTAPAITTTARTVGSGLQRSTSASLGASNHGGVDVVIASSDPSVLLLSPNSTTAGSDTITVTLADGNTSVSYFVQGVEGATGSPSVTVSAPGFTDGTATMTVVQPALQLQGPALTTTTLSNDGPFWVGVGIPNGQLTSIAEWQNVRPGGSLTATVTSSNVAVGQLVTTPLTGDTVTVDIVEGLYYSPTSVAAGGVAFDPITAGTTTVAASIPNIITLPTASRAITVTAPAITTTARTVGSGLQRNTSASLGASNHGGVDVVIASSDPSVLLLSPNSTTAGTDSITVTLADGSTSVSYYLQGVEGATGSPTVTVSAPGFTDGTATTTVVQPALQLQGPAATTTTLSNDGPFWVGVGIPNGQLTAIAEWQNVRPGGSLTATVTSSNVGVGQLVTTALTGGSVTVDIAAGLYYSPTSVATGGVAFDPLTTGTTTVAASIPNVITLPTASLEVTVTAPAITTTARTVGSGLQRSTSASLGAANHGGVDVVITSSNPSVMLVSPNSTTAGSDSITVTLTDGSTSVSYFVQGVEGATGTAIVTVSAPGFIDGTATITVVQPAVQLSGPAASTTVTSPDQAFWAGVGIPNAQLTAIAEWQNVRPGGSLTATVTSSNVGVGQLVTTALTGGSVTVDIVPGVYFSPTSVAAGGVAFDPLSTGVTTVSVAIPGFILLPTASVSVTVNP